MACLKHFCCICLRQCICLRFASTTAVAVHLHRCHVEPSSLCVLVASLQLHASECLGPTRDARHTLLCEAILWNQQSTHRPKKQEVIDESCALHYTNCKSLQAIVSDFRESVYNADFVHMNTIL